MVDAAPAAPRVANRLLKRVRDYAQVIEDGTIDDETARAALEMQGVDHLGLDRADRDYLGLVIDKFVGGPVGVGTISVALGEARDTVEEVFLLDGGTKRGALYVAFPSMAEHRETSAWSASR